MHQTTSNVPSPSIVPGSCRSPWMYSTFEERARCLSLNSSVASIPSQITTRVAPALSAENASSPLIPYMPPMSRNDRPRAKRAIIA